MNAVRSSCIGVALALALACLVATAQDYKAGAIAIAHPHARATVGGQSTAARIGCCSMLVKTVQRRTTPGMGRLPVTTTRSIRSQCARNRGLYLRHCQVSVKTCGPQKLIARAGISTNVARASMTVTNYKTALTT